MLKSIPKKKIVLLCGDILIIAAAIYIAPLLRLGTIPDPWSIFDLSNLVPTLVYVFIIYLFDLYDVQMPVDKANLALRLALAVFVISIINASMFYLFHLRPYSTWILFISSLLTLIFLVLWRLSFVYLASATAKPIRMLILGAGKTGRELYSLLRTKSQYDVIGFIDDDASKQRTQVDGLPVLGKSNELMDIIAKQNIRKIVVSVAGEIRPDVFPKLVEAKFRGVAVYEMPTIYEKVARKIPVLHTSHMWMGYADVYGVTNSVYNVKAKIILDKLLAVVGLILASPVMVLTAVLIRLESKGPALYRQERVGLDEKPFILFKFRSMCADAECDGAVWAQKEDTRVTRVGRIIRKTRIDELPQLWNVLKGDMSFVGPRPERTEFVEFLKKDVPYYMLRHSVRPGITGWAQVNYPYGASRNDALEKLQYDLYYIKNDSFLLDIHIMLRTLRVMLFGIGAR